MQFFFSFLMYFFIAVLAVFVVGGAALGWFFLYCCLNGICSLTRDIFHCGNGGDSNDE